MDLRRRARPDVKWCDRREGGGRRRTPLRRAGRRRSGARGRAWDRRPRRVASARLARAAARGRERARARRHRLRRSRRRAGCEAPRCGSGGGCREKRRGPRACSAGRGRRDDQPRRGGRPRRRLQGRLRRRRSELRLRPALGRARGGRGPGGCSLVDDRQPRPVGRRDVGARVSGRSVQEPLDPRAHELRRSSRRACRALPAARRARGRG